MLFFWQQPSSFLAWNEVIKCFCDLQKGGKKQFQDEGKLPLFILQCLLEYFIYAVYTHGRTALVEPYTVVLICALFSPD